MSHDLPYHYTPVCDVEGCDHPARYKVACRWGDGTQNELKNYGVYCAEHAPGELEAARDRQRRIHLGRQEELGPVQLFELVEGRRDAELIPVG
ncbi:hypothetical protein [Tautonia plasticadhaerens]|uniref:Uncharacterized protein n=1 Tax=Tautonia plasticadhaerens TaxID=2527974 RepID=A0A518GY44_9BACT|nr:hypothetical protein [Tautonia plasticadhaerens]QDV33511.1 hypothetical protein ElP_13840 [Tautonia plasticadhaerens]